VDEKIHDLLHILANLSGQIKKLNEEREIVFTKLYMRIEELEEERMADEKKKKDGLQMKTGIKVELVPSKPKEEEKDGKEKAKD
jgi:hypothetical protein